MPSPSPDLMTAAIDAYVDGFARGELEKIVALFDDDARVEDPVGAPVRVGKAAIREFYAGSLATGAKLKREGVVRTAADCAAFAFAVHLDYGGPKRIDVIDVFRFGPDGKIVEMRAYWGPDNMHDIAQQR